ncbi:MAG TPA: YdcF family protein [Crinalium sp.]
MRSLLFPSVEKRLAKRKRVSHSKRRFPIWRVLLLLLLVFIAYRQVEGYFRTPQAILVLGGATAREVYAAEFAQKHPDLPIWVSSGSNPEYTDWVFTQAGIDPSRLHLDFQASDTVTNFTTLVDEFESRHINSLYVITSDYHMRRAWIIGQIVLGSRGIDFKPIAVPSDQAPESLDKALRDGARALLWVTTGHTGSSLGRFFHQHY